MLSGSTLVAVVDGALARFLNRARPGAQLVEIAGSLMQAEEAAPERDRAPRVNDRFGGGRHKIERRLTAHEAAEEAFLVDVAARIEDLLKAAPAASLALCAPPKALGLLRKRLSKGALQRAALVLSKDLTKETAVVIDRRLRQARV